MNNLNIPFFTLFYCSLRAGSVSVLVHVSILAAERRMGRGKVSLHESRWVLNSTPCEVTRLNYPGIKFLTKISEAKCKQRRKQIFALERSSLWMCRNSAKENHKNSEQLLPCSFQNVESGNLVVCPREIKSRRLMTRNRRARSRKS